MKKIPITQGRTVLVDDADFECLSQWKWKFSRQKPGKDIGYANRSQRTPGDYKKVKYIYMHRLIMNPPTGMQVDHINGNGLDNRRCNLRLCTSRKNTWGKGPQKNSITGVKGVHPQQSGKNYVAVINVNKKNIRLGTFLSIEEAARAYNQASLKYFGEFGYQNIL